MTKYGFEIQKIKDIAGEAGAVIMQIYATTFENTIENKDNNTPVTIADLKAHEVIENGLRSLNVVYPVFSEEGFIPEYANRKNTDLFWLVDPLDGTKEFIKRNGDFTVNIALINNDKPVFGCVYIPVTGEMYWGLEGKGAFMEKQGKISPLRVRTFKDEETGLRVLTSRSHVSNSVMEYLRNYKDPVILQRGSSMKMMLIAEGKADIYPRLGPTMEWDTAAAHIILLEAGGRIMQLHNAGPLLYNKEDLYNPHFIAMGKNES